MKVSSNVKRIGIAAVFVAEAALMVAIAYGAGDLPSESIIVGDGDVVIEVQDQRVFGALSISRVVTPVDGWVIVRADRDGEPGELIGAAQVSAGENENVPVALDPSRDLPRGGFVSVVADRGTRGEFEYATGDPDDTFSLGGGGGGMMGAAEEVSAMGSPMDWPLVAAEPFEPDYFEMTQFDVTYRLTEANIGGAFLDATGRAAQISGILAPDESWVVITRVSGGENDSNEVVGASRVPAGRTDSLSIPISEVPDGTGISAMLVADLGQPDVLEYDAVDPSRSVDAPYFVRSWFVYKRVAPAH